MAKEEFIKLKEEIHQLKFEKAIKELNEEVKKYKNKNTFGKAFATTFRRLQRALQRANRPKKTNKRKRKRS